MGKNPAVWYANFVIVFNKKLELNIKSQTDITLIYFLANDQFGVVSLDQGRSSLKTIYKYYTKELNACLSLTLDTPTLRHAANFL